MICIYHKRPPDSLCKPRELLAGASPGQVRTFPVLAYHGFPLVVGTNHIVDIYNMVSISDVFNLDSMPVIHTYVGWPFSAESKKACLASRNHPKPVFVFCVH